MRILISLLSIPLATAALYACGASASDHVEEEIDVVLEGDVSDESFTALASALEQAEPAENAGKAATLTSPADNDSLSAGAAPTFSWTIGTSAMGSLPRSSKLRHAALELLPRSKTPDRPWAPLLSLFAPISVAHAHGDPFNGTGTLLVFSTASAPELVRAFTGALTYKPSAEAWGKMTSAGIPITVTLVSAEFEADRVVAGPFAGSTIKFTVTK